MLRTLQNLEEVSLQMTPVVVVLPGLVLLGIGLCLWLGGLRWNRVVAGIIGAMSGALCGVLFGKGHQVFASSVMTLVGASLGSVFRKTVVILVGGVVTTAIGLVVFSLPFLSDESNWQAQEGGINIPGGSEERLSAGDSVGVLKSQVVGFFTGVRNCVSQVKPLGFVTSIIAGLVIIGCGLFAPRFIVAAISAMLGTGIIFAGMNFLLLYKGAEPMTRIYHAGTFYKLVVLVMIAFGTAVGLLVCSDTGKKSAKKNDSGEKQ
jgi:hypothetical protein